MVRSYFKHIHIPTIAKNDSSRKQNNETTEKYKNVNRKQYAQISDYTTNNANDKDKNEV